jgi:hypothetical protein
VLSMQVNKTLNSIVVILVAASIILLSELAVVKGYSEENPEQKIVVSGIDFVLTQKDVDAYGAYFASQKVAVPEKEVIREVLKYELLSREYRKSSAVQPVRGKTDDSSAEIVGKIQDTIKFISKILNDYNLPEIVIESYYRSNPEKFRTGDSPDDTFSVKPFDDQLKEEIRFSFIERKKKEIVREYVNNLISTYQIKILN